MMDERTRNLHMNFRGIPANVADISPSMLIEEMRLMHVLFGAATHLQHTAVVVTRKVLHVRKYRKHGERRGVVRRERWITLEFDDIP